MAACECALCGRKFSGLTTFDAHQDVDYKRQPRVICREPSEIGMKLNGHGLWASAQERRPGAHGAILPA